MEARATDNVLQIRTLGSLGIEEQLTASGQTIIERAESMRIGNAREYEDAAAFLVEIKKRSKQMKEYWKPSKDAAKAAHARICEQEKAMLAPMERAEKTIKAGMARYQTAEAEARREAEREAIKRQQIERDRLMNEAAEAEQLRKEEEARLIEELKKYDSDYLRGHARRGDFDGDGRDGGGHESIRAGCRTREGGRHNRQQALEGARGG